MMTPEERKAAYREVDSGFIEGVLETATLRAIHADHEAAAAKVTRLQHRVEKLTDEVNGYSGAADSLQAEVERLTAPVGDKQVSEALASLSVYGDEYVYGIPGIEQIRATLTRKLDQQSRIIEAFDALILPTVELAAETDGFVLTFSDRMMFTSGLAQLRSLRGAK